MHSCELKDEGMSPTVKAMYDLISNASMYMMGAKNISYSNDENTLRWRMGRNKSGGNTVVLKYDPAKDLYDIEIFSIRGTSVKSKHKETGLYADQVKPWLADKTKLYLSLKEMRHP